MREAVICEPLRTPVGRYGGVFKEVGRLNWRPPSSSSCSGAPASSPTSSMSPPGPVLPERRGPGYRQGRRSRRRSARQRTGYQLDRRCGSGLQTVINAAMQVQTGASDLVLAGGVESMSQAEYYTTSMRWGARAEHTHHVDRLARGRVTAGGKLHRCRAA